MNKEKILVILIYSATLVLFLFNAYLNSISLSNSVLKPKGSNFNIFSISKALTPPKHIVYGFLPYWTLNRAEYLQMDKLTDMSYFALHIEPDGSIRKYQNPAELDPGYNNWRNNDSLLQAITKAKLYGVRVSLTIISHEDDVTDQFLSCKTCWQTFITELKEELNYREITDVNLDFELVEYAEEDIADRYTKFAEYVNMQLDEEYDDSRVVVSTFADSMVKSRITKPGDLAKVTDGLFIMAYDFHRPTSDVAGPVAPIGGSGIYAEYDIKTMLTDYIAAVPPSKLILGVPYYGYNWVVYSPAPYSPRIEGNDLIGYSGSQTYADVMDTTLEYRPQIYWDDVSQTPYFSYISSKTGMTRQVHFENEASLRVKYDIAKDLNFAGVGIWALGYDKGYQELWNLLGSEFPRKTVAGALSENLE